ncbi:MAG TPA: class 1 fructose-bisphosphatase [Chloroflexi bacterium]|nr:class 1 fructose-bisphosphatase [Chloroflexota bacterium]
MPKVITIERHLLEQQRHFPQATGAFTNLMYDIALAAKLIARETTRAGLADILGMAGATNTHGEEQQKLDVYADQTIYRMMDHTGRLCIMASEEHAEPLHIPDHYPCGSYVLLYDPLDGSSNIDYNVSIGTIFSIHRKISEGERGTMADLLQPGYRQVAAGYVIFGSSTMLVYSAGRGVHGFTLDPSIGEFLLSHPDIRVPDKPKYYSVNQGYERYWSEGIRRYVEWLTGRDPEGTGPGLSLRYIGSLVADFHRNLMTGGIFMYPADRRDPAKPHGKLRLTYECAPLAFIAEQAGGYASDGVNPIRSIQPHDLHQRIPFFVGNRELVERVEEYIRRYDADWVEQYREQTRLAQDEAVSV